MNGHRPFCYDFCILILFGCGVIALSSYPAWGVEQSTLIAPERLVSDFEARLALARLLSYGDHQLDEALHEYRILLKQHPQDAQIRLELARVLVRQRKYSNAIRQLQILLDQMKPVPAKVYAELGDACLYSGRLPSAIEKYRKALEISPASGPIQKKLALALSWNKQHREALSLLDQLHEKYPSDPEIGRELVRVYAKTGKTETALRTARTMHGAFSQDADFLANLADLEASFGHAEKCRHLYLKALKLTDNREKVLLRFADQMIMWGDFYKAESIYREYLKKNPEAFAVHLKLASLLVTAQRYEEVEGIYRRLLLDRPESEEVILGLIELKFLEKDFSASLRYIEQLLASKPGHPKGILFKGEMLSKTEHYDEAHHGYRRLLEIEPYRQEALLEMGKVYLKQNEHEKAREAFTMAYQMAPQDIEVRYYYAGKDKVTSRGFLKALLEPGRESPMGLVQWARLYASHGFNQIAINCYEAGLKQDPQCFPARMELAETLAIDHQYSRSLESFESFAKEFPSNSKVSISWARVLAWSGRYDQSIELYNKVAKMNPSDPVPQREMARTAAWAKMMEKSKESFEAMWDPPVDKRLLSALEPVQSSVKNRGLEDCCHRIRETCQGGSIYEGYEIFSRELARFQESLSPRHGRRLQNLLVDLLPFYKIQKAAYLENQAKWFAYKERFTRARDAYEALIDFQPGNEEAIFDYAQVHCALGLCDREEEIYERLQAIDPLHSLAGTALDRQRIRRRPSVKSGHSYWEEEGRGELTQIVRHRMNVSLDIPVYCRYHLRVIAQHWLEDPKLRGDSYDARGHSLEIEGIVNPFIKGSLSWTKKYYEDSVLDDNDTGYAKLYLNLRDRARLGFGYERKDELYNDFGVRQGIQADHWWAGLSSRPGPGLELDGHATYINYNDDNEGQLHSISLGYAFTDHPGVIKLIGTAQYRDTKRKNVYCYHGDELVDIIHPYWTPQDYFAGDITLEWHHDLSKLSFCGSQRHSYDVRLSTGTDSDNNKRVGVELKWDYEFHDHWMVNLKAMIDRSSEWDANAFWATVQYRF